MSTSTMNRPRSATRVGTLRVARHTLDVVDQLVLAAGRRETCGFLVGGAHVNGRDGTAYRVVPMENVAEQPELGYEMAPLHLLAFEDGLLTTGEDVVAVWHSHPDRLAAVPSMRDRDHARVGTPFQYIVSTSVHFGRVSDRKVYTGDFSSPARLAVLGEDPDDVAMAVRP